MAGPGDSDDDSRLAGRAPRSARRAPDEVEETADPDDDEMDTVNRLMGFLRGED